MTPMTRTRITVLALLSIAAQGCDRIKQTTFATPEAAAEALINAAEKNDIPTLKQILGEEGLDLVVTEDTVQDRNIMADFAAQGRALTRIDRDSGQGSATLIVGTDEFPVAIPIVEKGGLWYFDTETGRQEILNRRIGRNELDAIEVAQIYVDAQREYALDKHDGAIVNQYAQRMISTQGKQDGLAWQAADGSWHGPIGEGIARAIAEGYSSRKDPLHGYYFKVLKGQGPDAPLGELDFVVDSAMIGGFALVAAPADYGITGVKTFIVSHSGIVYEKDLGETTLEQFQAMELYNPDSSWTPVQLP
jgi:hypothetical protein